MEQYIANYLIQNYPQIAGYAVFAFVVGLLMWKATNFYRDTKDVTTKLPVIETTLQRIERGFQTLNQILLEKQVISQSCYTNENSPRVINEIGEKLLKDSGAENLFNEIKSDLLNKLKEKKFDSLLELERECLNVLLEKMNDQRFKGIQNFAFEHPTFENMILTYSDILFVMSLRLRDEYRSQNPLSGLG